MADADPIKQRIEVDYDPTGAEAAAGGIEDIGTASDAAAEGNQRQADTAAGAAEATREQGKAAGTAAGKVDDLARETGDAGEKATTATRAHRRQTGTLDDEAKAAGNAAREQGKLADESDEAGRAAGDAADATDGLGGILAGLVPKGNLAAEAVGAVGSKLAGLATAGAVLGVLTDEWSRYTAAVIANSEAMKANGELARSQAEDRLNLAALAGVETPEDVAFLDSVSAVTGRGQGEVARLKATAKSQFPAKSAAEIDSMTLETGLLGRTADSPLAELFPLIATAIRGTDGDARKASNIAVAAVDQAGVADPAALAPLLERFVPVARGVGGLDIGEAVGLGAAATGVGLPGDQAITGFMNLVLSLRGKGTGEGNAILEREGIEQGPQADLLASIEALGKALAEGRIGPDEAETIAGREAVPAVASLGDPATLAGLLEKIALVDAAEDQEGRVTVDRIEAIVGSSVAQAANLQAKQLEQVASNTRAKDPRALEAVVVRAALDAVLAQREAEGVVAPAESETIRNFFEFNFARGASAEASLEDAATRAAGDDPTSFIDRVRGAVASDPTLNLLGGVEPAARRRNIVEPVLELANAGPELGTGQATPPAALEATGAVSSPPQTTTDDPATLPRVTPPAAPGLAEALPAPPKPSASPPALSGFEEPSTDVQGGEAPDGGFSFAATPTVVAVQSDTTTHTLLERLIEAVNVLDSSVTMRPMGGGRQRDPFPGLDFLSPVFENDRFERQP